MEDCATTRTHFRTSTGLLLEAAFDGGRLTSDSGLIWLSEVDEDLLACAKPWPSTYRSGERGKDATPWWSSSSSASSR